MLANAVKSVLLVEDNPGDVRLLREMLSEQSGQQTRFAHVACMSDAEEFLSANVVDIILLDLGLPDAQGLTVVRRAHAAAPFTPLVVLTGLDDEELATQALQEGVEDYLIKGEIETRALLRALRYSIERNLMARVSQQEKERLLLQGAALESIADGVVITEPDWTILWVNPAFTRITGWTAAEALGRKPSFLHSGEHDDATYDELARTVLEGRVWDGELTNRRKDGTLYVQAQTITPVRNARGEITHLVTVKRDISQRRRLEEELRQSQKLEGIGRLAGGVAHDFNNILGVIMGYGELVQRRIADVDPIQGKMTEIMKAAARGAALTRQLLAFSRNQILQPQVLDLNAVVGDMDEMLRRLIGENIELKTVLQEPLGSVRADPGQIEQVLMNLVVNARDAITGAGSVVVETAEVDLDETYVALHRGTRAGRYVLIAVSDTGQGMDRATMDRIFEPFFTTKEQGRGTGLGLSTVYGIVEQSGGQIDVYSEVGRGTTFKVYLPRIEATAALATPAAEAPPPRRASETVLVVEDEASLRTIICEILTEEGYGVLEAGTPSHAVALAHGPGPIHAILTDVVMPEMTGRELALLLKPLLPEAPVVYMSGYTDDAIGQHGLLDPGMLFLQKPFTSGALLSTLERALASGMVGVSG